MKYFEAISLDAIRKRIDSINMPDITTLFKFEDEVYQKYIPKSLPADGASTIEDKKQEGWGRLRDWITNRLTILLQVSGDSSSITKKGAPKYLRDDLAALRETQKHQNESITDYQRRKDDVEEPASKEKEKRLAFVLFIWVFVGTVYFFYTFWLRIFMTEVSYLESVFAFFLAGLLMIPAHIVSRQYQKYPAQREWIEKATIRFSLGITIPALVLFGIMRGLGQSASSLSNNAYSFTSPSADALATPTGLDTVDILRIAIYAFLPLAEIGGTAYLLIAIKEYSSPSPETGEELDMINKKLESLRADKAKIDVLVHDLQSIISLMDSFEEMKERYITMTLIEAESEYFSKFDEKVGGLTSAAEVKRQAQAKKADDAKELKGLQQMMVDKMKKLENSVNSPVSENLGYNNGAPHVSNN